MASGDPVVQFLQWMATSGSHAQLDHILGTSTPPELFAVWAFDASSIEYVDFMCRLSGQYDGGGITLVLPWAAASATSNATRWEAAIRRIVSDAEDLNTTAHTYDYNAVDSTAASAAGEVVYPTIAFTDGADMDSWAAGEYALVRIRRNASHANDNMTGDAHLLPPSGYET